MSTRAVRTRPMSAVRWMVAAGVGSWLIVSAVASRQVNPEAFFGMIGPLCAAAGSWLAMVRAYGTEPERLTAVMVKALAIKAVFFGVYVAAMLRGLALRPIPFVVSFTSYFIALYLIEALFMRRLFLDGARTSR